MEMDIILKRFEENKNPENAKIQKSYMRNKFEFYGIKTPERRLLYKDIIKQSKKLKKIDFELLEYMRKDDKRESQYFVTDYLKAMNDFLNYEDIFIIEKYVRDKQRRDTIDVFDRIIGNIGLRDIRVDELMIRYSKDDNFWIRRISIDHQLNRKDRTNTELLSKIIKNNLCDNYENKDEEFFINKAIGRSLREYSKTNPIWVKEFIEANKDKMSKLSIKEASIYLN